jgi:hypothetical protein
MRQMELATLVQVTGKAGLRRFARIDDGIARATGLIVNAAGTVARFTAHVEGVGAFSHQFCVGGGGKVSTDIFVALGARVRSDELSSGNFGRSNDGAGYCCAGEQRDSGNRCKGDGDRSPGKTPLGRRPHVCSIGAHKLPSRSKAQTTRLLNKPQHLKNRVSTILDTSLRRLHRQPASTFAVKVDGRIKRCTKP